MKKIFAMSACLSVAVGLATAQDGRTIGQKIARLFEKELQELGKTDISKSTEIKKMAAPPSAEEIFDATLPILLIISFFILWRYKMQ